MTNTTSSQAVAGTGERYDVIVLGAGLGAMTAAAIQARRGKRVLVVEKHKVLGGYASVFGRKGFTFDVSLHQIGGVRKSRLKGLLEEAGVYDKLDFVKSSWLSELYLGPGQDLLRIPNGDMKAWERALIARFPAERRAIRLWFWTMRRFGRQISYFDQVRCRNPLKQGAVIFAVPLFAPFLLLTSFWMPPLGLALRTKNPELRRILLHFSGYYGAPAHEINMLFPMAANFSYYNDGGYYLKGGGYEIVRQLSLVVRRNNGRILTGKTAERILTDGNRVIGLRLGGEEGDVYAPEIVCGANPFTVYGDLLRDHPVARRQLQRISRMETGMTASVLYLKLDVPPERLNPAFADTYEYVEPPLDEVAFYERFRSRTDFSTGYEEDGFAATVHSVADPAALKGGNGALMDIFYCDNYDRWAALSEEDYRARKETEIRKMLDAAERHLPGLRDHIEVLELATPRTMEKFTSNRRGALYGFAQSRSQASRWRFGIESPLRGLSFVSAWSNPGGGYEGVLRAADSYSNPITWKALLVFVLLVAASTQIGTLVRTVLELL
ncbi:MAG: NAD(P)/FAD-dependent oxidoreductase [Paracoccaceae bacterium]